MSNIVPVQGKLHFSVPAYIAAGTMTGTATIAGPGHQHLQLRSVAFQAQWTGTPVGTCSGSPSARTPTRRAIPSSAPCGPGVLPSVARRQYPAGAVGSWVFFLSGLSTPWVQLTYTNASSIRRYQRRDLWDPEANRGGLDDEYEGADRRTEPRTDRDAGRTRAHVRCPGRQLRVRGRGSPPYPSCSTRATGMAAAVLNLLVTTSNYLAHAEALAGDTTSCRLVAPGGTFKFVVTAATGSTPVAPRFRNYGNNSTTRNNISASASGIPISNTGFAGRVAVRSQHGRRRDRRSTRRPGSRRHRPRRYRRLSKATTATTWAGYVPCRPVISVPPLVRPRSTHRQAAWM